MLFNLSMVYIFIPYPFENTVCLNMTELKCNPVKQKIAATSQTTCFCPTTRTQTRDDTNKHILDGHIWNPGEHSVPVVATVPLYRCACEWSKI